LTQFRKDFHPRLRWKYTFGNFPKLKRTNPDRREMSGEPGSVPTSGSFEATEMPSGSPKAGYKTSESLFPQVSDLIKLAGVAYAIGFAVIMVHTARLNGPVVEALQFQNIVAGLPVWVPLCVGIWLWPKLIRQFAGGENYKVELDIPRISVLGISLLLGVGLIYAIIRWLVGRSFSISESLVLMSATLFALMLSIAVQVYRHEHYKVGTDTALFTLMCAYSGIIFLVLGYAIFGYPMLPQTIGGGRPVRIKMYFKDGGLSTLMGGTPASGEQAATSDPVYLYYRTGSYLLVSKTESQPLIEIPADQIRAVVWLDSRSK
jgi:hypothetical protein